MGIRIRGVGSYVPERVLTNADLEKMVDTSDEWIVTRTGIRQRHIAAPEQACSDIAAGAAKAALANCGMDATELDLIIVSTISPDMAIPKVPATRAWSRPPPGVSRFSASATAEMYP